MADVVVPPEVTAEVTQILSNLVLGDNQIRSRCVSPSHIDRSYSPGPSSSAEQAVDERLARTPELYLLAIAQFATSADTELVSTLPRPLRLPRADYSSPRCARSPSSSFAAFSSAHLPHSASLSMIISVLRPSTLSTASFFTPFSTSPPPSYAARPSTPSPIYQTTRPSAVTHGTPSAPRSSLWRTAPTSSPARPPFASLPAVPTSSSTSTPTPPWRSSSEVSRTPRAQRCVPRISLPLPRPSVNISPFVNRCLMRRSSL